MGLRLCEEQCWSKRGLVFINQFLHRKSTVKKLKIDTGLTIFILFFGISLIEAFESHHWLEAGLFLLLGAVSYWADRRKP